MTVADWLHRLNLLKLKPRFDKHKFYRVDDLKHVADEGQIAEFELTETDDTKL